MTNRSPAPRIDATGPVCMICGKGPRSRSPGGLSAAAGALRQLGYVWDYSLAIGQAHLPCVEREQQLARGKPKWKRKEPADEAL